MHHRPRPAVCAAVLLAGLWLSAGLAAAATEISPSALLVLGPLPAPMGEAGAGPLAPELQPVPEIDPVTVDPHAGDEVVLDPRGAVSWREVIPGAGGAISLPKEGVYWLAARPTVDRWTRLAVTVRHGGGGSRGTPGARPRGA